MLREYCVVIDSDAYSGELCLSNQQGVQTEESDVCP